LRVRRYKKERLINCSEMLLVSQAQAGMVFTFWLLMNMLLRPDQVKSGCIGELDK
jgi:hypothetical protein